MVALLNMPKAAGYFILAVSSQVSLTVHIGSFLMVNDGEKNCALNGQNRYNNKIFTVELAHHSS